MLGDVARGNTLKSLPVIFNSLGTPQDPLRKFLASILLRAMAWTVEEVQRRTDDYIHGRSPKIVTPTVDRIARFIIAITRGLSLVIPMLIMRMNQNTTKSLITTSVAVLLFSAMVSIPFKASNAETLGITAAYAAVLVVIVGTSSQG